MRRTADWATAKAETLLPMFSDHRTVDVETIAAALREAREDGKQAGLERAREIASELEHRWASDLEADARGYGSLNTPSPSQAIRAAKGIKI